MVIDAKSRGGAHDESKGRSQYAIHLSDHARHDTPHRANVERAQVHPLT